MPLGLLGLLLPNKPSQGFLPHPSLTVWSCGLLQPSISLCYFVQVLFIYDPLCFCCILFIVFVLFPCVCVCAILTHTDFFFFFLLQCLHQPRGHTFCLFRKCLFATHSFPVWFFCVTGHQMEQTWWSVFYNACQRSSGHMVHITSCRDQPVSLHPHSYIHEYEKGDFCA